LELLSRLLDNYPNLYIDNSARFALSGPIPRTMKKFYTRYENRILFGTDSGRSPEMYRISFRILETADEHFYHPGYHYHWSYSGLDLGNRILKKVYYKNAKRIFLTGRFPGKQSFKKERR
jgi:predicted TIM-barrel fold metal-dependent hydrolase